MRGRSIPLTVLLTVLLTGCSAAGAVDVVAVDSVPPAAPTTSVTTEPVPVETTTTTMATTTTTILSTTSLGEGESLAARADEPLDVYAQPGATDPAHVMDAATMLGTPRVVQVLDGPVDGWMRVALPMRPNGSEGWVLASDVTLFMVDRRVEIDLTNRTLEVIGPDGTLLETSIGIGSSTNPTPVGSFFVTDSVIVSDPGGPWGPHAFGLSAYSDTITEFNGGNGIVGIHGTNQPSSIGQARSLGCVRIPNDVALDLAKHISAGVPVVITA